MKLARRSFLKKSLAAAFATPVVMSLEEHALMGSPSSAGPSGPANAVAMPTGKIGNVTISRLICGGNLISGFAHSRDLIYVSQLLKHYFSDEKIMETWALCEQHGINTMIATPLDPHAVEVYCKYRSRGGKIQFLAQLVPEDADLKGAVQKAVDAGAVGALLAGDQSDLWTREGNVDRIGQIVNMIKDQGMIAGVAGHELRTVKTVEQAGIKPDFYMKTLHAENYWSHRQPAQDKEVIDNYGIDNYWCMDPRETIRFMSELERPWIAYKVLAAGAIHPRSGFKYAFENGADFALVGMFDFQVAENAGVAAEVLKTTKDRERRWMA